MSAPTHHLVLHALRVGGHASTALVARHVGITEDAAEGALLDLAAAGLVTRWAGEFGGWAPSPEGRAAAERRAVTALAADPEARAAVESAYDEFLLLNPEALEACAAWQLRRRGGVSAANHHDDPAYDAQVLRRLGRLLVALRPVVSRLAEVDPRFARYGERLAAALARAQGGDRSAITDTTDSVHTVWFHLHEDLLVSLGRPRW